MCLCLCECVLSCSCSYTAGLVLSSVTAHAGVSVSFSYGWLCSAGFSKVLLCLLVRLSFAAYMEEYASSASSSLCLNVVNVA